jgi:four helix bundle protein
VLAGIKPKRPLGSGRRFARLDPGSAPRRRRIASTRRKENIMLRIYTVILETIRTLQPTIERIQKKDPDLGRQMRRAASSIALNVSEGSYSRGGNRQVRYHSALGSARETLACLEVAAVLGNTAEVDEDMRNRFDTILGTLVKLV